ncbi:PH domain-containing protein [Phycicoccus sp. BSK3Z-2]|uniref:PH domain-containing protein n=1 Tax=Phycicoccus avicenniae TaxID=2828860 RepID=A0A941D8H7_9MICO|nr:PH domain-containing protein [Phycicoccus avicenniae]MBR7744059.1 PH domain-containing protein [Phycicoccus avicenniae]
MTAPEVPVVDQASDDGWQRLHPLSPLLRGGVVLLAVLGYFVSQLVDRVLSSFDPGEDPTDDLPGGADGGVGLAVVDHPFIALAVLVVVVAAIAGAFHVSWRFTRFRVTGAQVELRNGVLFRQHRQVPLERIQAVETTRPILARLVGLSQVVVQSAGGSDSHLTLAFLAEPRAEALRAELLDLASRTDEGPGPAAADADVPDGAAPAQVPAGARDRTDEGTPVVAVPNGRLVASTLLHGPTVVAAVLLVLLVVAGGVSSVLFDVGPGVLAAVPALLPAAFAFGVGRVRELLLHGNFRMTRTSNALRMRHGLTELRASVVPLHRVQAVEAVQPVLWRPFGWWRMRVNVAGTGQSEGQEVQAALLPVGTIADVDAVLAPLGADPHDPLVRAALHGTGRDGGWTGPPPAARLFDPWSWERNGYALGDEVLHVRTGRFSRRMVLVPYARVQSLTLSQGPWERRRGLAEARVVSTPGPVSAAVRHLSVADAEAFLDVVGEAARRARRSVPGPAPDAAATARGDSPGNGPPLAPTTSTLVDWPSPHDPRT